jgi:hypothetical protein
MPVATSPNFRRPKFDAVSDQGCENCGFPDGELVRVRRVYVVPAAWDREGSETVMPDPEWWCVSCCSQYPNEPVASL